LLYGAELQRKQRIRVKAPASKFGKLISRVKQWIGGEF
jgi:hypothetical protein